MLIQIFKTAIRLLAARSHPLTFALLSHFAPLLFVIVYNHCQVFSTTQF